MLSQQPRVGVFVYTQLLENIKQEARVGRRCDRTSLAKRANSSFARGLVHDVDFSLGPPPPQGSLRVGSGTLRHSVVARMRSVSTAEIGPTLEIRCRCFFGWVSVFIPSLTRLDWIMPGLKWFMHSLLPFGPQASTQLSGAPQSSALQSAS